MSHVCQEIRLHLRWLFEACDHACLSSFPLCKITCDLDKANVTTKLIDRRDHHVGLENAIHLVDTGSLHLPSVLPVKPVPDPYQACLYHSPLDYRIYRSAS